MTAAVIAYVLDPPATRLTRLGLPRGVAALVMMLALLACVLLFALLLYPLILSQVGMLIGRVPQYVQDAAGLGQPARDANCSSASGPTW